MLATSHFIGCLLTKEAGRTDEKHNDQQDKCKCIAEGGLAHGNQGCLSKPQDKASDHSAGDASDPAEYSCHKALEPGQGAGEREYGHTVREIKDGADAGQQGADGKGKGDGFIDLDSGFSWLVSFLLSV